MGRDFGAVARFFGAVALLALEATLEWAAVTDIDDVGAVVELLAAVKDMLVVASKTCIRSFFSVSSFAGSKSRFPAQLMRRMLRLTRGVMLFLLSFVKVRVWSSGISLAGGVDGIEPAEPGGETFDLLGCEGWWERDGEAGLSCETNASAALLKTKPRCSRAVVTVRRA